MFEIEIEVEIEIGCGLKVAGCTLAESGSWLWSTTRPAGFEIASCGLRVAGCTLAESGSGPLKYYPAGMFEVEVEVEIENRLLPVSNFANRQQAAQYQ